MDQDEQKSAICAIKGMGDLTADCWLAALGMLFCMWVFGG